MWGRVRLLWGNCPLLPIEIDRKQPIRECGRVTCISGSTAAITVAGRKSAPTSGLPSVPEVAMTPLSQRVTCRVRM